MPDTLKTPQTIAEYIDAFPPEIQAKLNEMHAIIRAALPKEAGEKISWAMPTYCLYGNLVHFAGNKAHIGFHPGSEALERFSGRLEGRVSTKGGVQFPYQDPLPKELIQDMVRFRVEHNERARQAKENP